MTTPILKGLFSSPENVLKEFDAKPDVLDGAELLYAWYEYEDYSGDTLVVFRKGGELFEVSGGHCSCNGLEGQWRPTRTTAEAMLMRENLPDGLREMLTALPS